MNEQTISVADAKKHFSELLGKVAHGKEQILITKRGKPMARLVPAEQADSHPRLLCDNSFILVTGNIRHFAKIKGPVTENWLASS